jgi:hypothetical protein
MIAGMYQARKSNLGDLMKFLTGRLKIETREERIWLLIGIISIALFLFWAGALVYAYLGDDRVLRRRTREVCRRRGLIRNEG